MAEYRRSAWFQGLLDAEAGNMIEPQDYDWPGFSDYYAGVVDYRKYRIRLLGMAIEDQQHAIRSGMGRLGHMMLGDGLGD